MDMVSQVAQYERSKRDVTDDGDVRIRFPFIVATSMTTGEINRASDITRPLYRQAS